MGWFEKELNYARGRYDDDDTTDIAITPKTSLTGRLWDYMGPTNWGWSGTKDDPAKESRDKIQREVAGTVNLLNNSTDGNEKSLKLGFSNSYNTANDIASDTVIMPADIVDQTGSEEDAIDVMSGMALIASTMKTTVDFHAYSDATIAMGPRQPSTIKGGHYIWTALEQAIARRAVSDKWPGFDSYFDAHRNHCTSIEGKDIDSMLEEDKANGVKGGISRRTAMVAAAYNTLNPRDAKLMSDSRMRKAMNLIADLALEGEKRDRFHKSVNIADFINRSFDKEEEEEDQEKQPDEDSSPTPEGGKPDGGDGDKDKDKDKGEDKDDSKEDSKEDGDGEGDDPFGDLPTQADSTLFGGEMDVAGGDEDESPRSLDELTLPNVSTREGGPLLIRIYGYPKSEVKKRAGEYRKMVNESKGEIKAVINSLLFMNNHPESHIHGMRHGSLDPGSLHKLAIDTDNPTVFEQVENITGKRIAVSLLIDRSGSMCTTSTYEGGMSKSTRQQDANRVAMILIEALSRIDGIELNVHTHCTFPHANCTLKQEIVTGHAGMASDDMTIHNIVTKDDDARQMLADLGPGGNNLDGYAIKHIAEGMSKDYHDRDERVLFVISDGQPHACNYGHERAMNHVGDCCSFSRAIHRTKVYGIGIANAFSQEEGKRMYGEGNFIVLKDVTPSIKVMTSFLRKVAVKQ